MSHVYLNDVFAPELPKTGNFLDLGAGIGRWSTFFSDAGFDVIAVELKERPSDLPERVKWTICDLSKELPGLEAGTFSAVYLRNVIQFLPKERFVNDILPWAKSLLQNGGVLGIETFFGRINPAPGPKPHPAYYTAVELRELCADVDVRATEQYRADMRDMEGTTREFSITILVAKKR